MYLLFTHDWIILFQEFCWRPATGFYWHCKGRLAFSASMVHLLTIQISGQAAFDLKRALSCPSLSGRLDVDPTLRSKGIRRLYLQPRQAWRSCSLSEIWCETLWEHWVESGSSGVLRGKESHTSQERSNIWSTFRIFSERDKRSLGMPLALLVAVASLTLVARVMYWRQTLVCLQDLQKLYWPHDIHWPHARKQCNISGSPQRKPFSQKFTGVKSFWHRNSCHNSRPAQQPPDITIATCNPTVSGWWVSAESQCPFSSQTQLPLLGIFI